MTEPRQLDPYASPKTFYGRPSTAPNCAACVEVVDGLPGVVPVRDSKAPEGPALITPASGWTAFVTALKDNALPTH